MRRGYFRICSSVSVQPSYIHPKKWRTVTTCTICVCHSCGELPLSVWVFLDIMCREYTLFNTYKVFLQASCIESQNMTHLCDFCTKLLWTVSSTAPPWLHVHLVMTFTLRLVVKDRWWSAWELKIHLCIATQLSADESQHANKFLCLY